MSKYVPSIVAIVLLLFLGTGGYIAYSNFEARKDPSSIPSALVSKPVPAFELPAISGVDLPGLSQTDLMAGQLTLVNVFASWCAPCRAEHAVLTRMKEAQGFRLVGINYKDRAEDAAAWLTELGNPYDAIGHDFTGRAGIEWGVTGVPETFIVDAAGIILHRFAGPVVGDGQRRFQIALDAAKAGS
ncbi:MAG: DsbE family thiol:disulfide interchange protein [Pseudomonadota bacterium]